MALCVSVRVMGILAAHHTQPQAGLLTNASSCFLSLIFCVPCTKIRCEEMERAPVKRDGCTPEMSEILLPGYVHCDTGNVSRAIVNENYEC